MRNGIPEGNYVGRARHRDNAQLGKSVIQSLRRNSSFYFKATDSFSDAF